MEITFRRREKTTTRTRMVWAADSQDGRETYERTSRTKAALAFCRKHPDKDFTFTFPPTDEANHPTIVLLGKDEDRWAIKTSHNVVMSRHGNLPNAISALFGNFPFVEEFQIALSNTKGG